MNKKPTLVLTAGVLLQALTGCSVTVPGIGLIGIGWDLIVAIVLILAILIGAIVVFGHRS